MRLQSLPERPKHRPSRVSPLVDRSARQVLRRALSAGLLQRLPVFAVLNAGKAAERLFRRFSLAYQIAFDRQETESQGFVRQAVSRFSASTEVAVFAAAAGEVQRDEEELNRRMQQLKRILADGPSIDLAFAFLF